MMDEQHTPTVWHMTHLPAPPAPDLHPDPRTDMQLKYLADRLTAVEACLSVGTDRMVSINAELAANTAVTNDVRAILAAAKGAFTVLGWLGVVIKWVGGIATAVAAIYTIFYMATHNGRLPGD